MKALGLFLLQSVVVTGMPAPDRVSLEDGRTLALYGLHTPALDEPLLAEAAELAEGRWAVEEHEEWRDGEYVPAFFLTRDDGALSVELCRLGLALGSIKSRSGAHRGKLVAAARRAQAARCALWSDRRGPPESLGDRTLPLVPPGFVGGVTLPLHSKDPEYAYERELLEIRELGASWVNLLVVTMVDRVDSAVVEPRCERTPPDARLVETIALAREIGLEVLVLPIVLIREPGPDDWRGRLRPGDEDGFWQSYDAFLTRVADLSAEGGASALAVGSELSSLEERTSAWRRVIENVRCRFPGWLTYSANWDHFSRIRFWGNLDFAGLTGYFELSDEDHPRHDDLVAGWTEARRQLERLGRSSGLPVVFTEVGLPSQKGAAGWPWDYTRRGPVDLELQRASFEAFHSVYLPNGVPRPPFHGVFLYDWWGWGGPEDDGYTARGKPAAEVWRRILKGLR